MRNWSIATHTHYLKRPAWWQNKQPACVIHSWGWNGPLQVGEYNRLDPKSSIHSGVHLPWQNDKRERHAGKRRGGGCLEERPWRHSSKQWWHVTGIVRTGASLCHVVIRFSIAMNPSLLWRLADTADPPPRFRSYPENYRLGLSWRKHKYAIAVGC